MRPVVVNQHTSGQIYHWRSFRAFSCGNDFLKSFSPHTYFLALLLTIYICKAIPPNKRHALSPVICITGNIQPILLFFISYWSSVKKKYKTLPGIPFLSHWSLSLWEHQHQRLFSFFYLSCISKAYMLPQLNTLKVYNPIIQQIL